MTWSQRFIAKLKSDFTGFEGDPHPIKTERGGYSEGPCLIKRNGIYYYLYTLGGSEAYQYAYMTSCGSPLGPWEAPEQDIIATNDLQLYFVKPTTGHAYRLECSLDGESWRPYGGHDDSKVRSPHTDAHPARARYLKLTILKGTPGLWDFRVY